MAARGPQIGRRGLERGPSHQLLQNKSFDTRSRSMRKGCGGEKNKKRGREYQPKGDRPVFRAPPA